MLFHGHLLEAPVRPGLSFTHRSGGSYPSPSVENVTLTSQQPRALKRPPPQFDSRRIVADAKWSGMYRVKLPGGGVMVNLTRAKDAALALWGEKAARHVAFMLRGAACAVLGPISAPILLLFHTKTVMGDYSLLPIA